MSSKKLRNLKESHADETLPKPGNTVLLKVNLIGPKSSDSAAITHCEFVRATSNSIENLLVGFFLLLLLLIH